MKKESKTKRLIIVHDWEGNPEEGWFPWLKKEMEENGWEVLVPAMPEPDHPIMDSWLAHLIRVAGGVDENTFLVGHSLGCITILRFLENLPSERKIGGAVLVAGFDNPLKYGALKNFFEAPIVWRKIRDRCKKFVSIHSQDDPYVPADNGERFKLNLKAQEIFVDGFRHFSGENGTYELPLVRDELLKISR
ncbi:MAG: hypothetical protein A2Y57_02515 [Candidatus Woykebacteria bacterium RBG_13_40_7b]|uniref:Alpha/beta hydrolase n=1 Tax=Candidatus Woykebacteria bacterium RBG_13_40_7b TaxID=1802594 RepID=A0A1G1WCK1_9BACT|nr:MAG: hypothetical protein A2Y57_02515 [Candidatus Woykebacteria bacterium RBG_13_40_7b]